MDFQMLPAFVAGYLHQDWDTEYDDAADAVGDFASKEPPSTVDATVSELDALLSMELSDEELTRWLVENGCYYRPIASTREWLWEVRDQLIQGRSQ